MKKDLLLIIDMQNVYGEGGQWYCPGVNEAGEGILSLSEKKKDELDIVLTKYMASDNPKGQWKQYNTENREVNEDDHANALMAPFAELAAKQKLPVFDKCVYSSMAIPEVKTMARKADRVAVCGVVAECCVLSTVMALIDEGCKVIYLTDAVAGISKETEKAVETVLEGLEPLHVQRMTVEQYLGDSNGN